MQKEQEPLILTVRLDAESQAFFNAQRQLHFPPERNFLQAHLTLFHHLPNEASTMEYLQHYKFEAFEITVTGLMNLGGGVAYKLESEPLQKLRNGLKQHFAKRLIPQDCQGFRPHITIQNKVLPQQAKALLGTLAGTFEPFTIRALGLDVWAYLGGPWRHELEILF